MRRVETAVNLKESCRLIIVQAILDLGFRAKYLAVRVSVKISVTSLLSAAAFLLCSLADADCVQSTKIYVQFETESQNNQCTNQYAQTAINGS